jgi:glutathione peroxidase
MQATRAQVSSLTRRAAAIKPAVVVRGRTNMKVVAFRANSLYDFTVKDINGQDVKLEQFKGKVSLIVNVASECQTTPQYKDLQHLYDNYKEKGFTVLGFPCNQFGNEEPGTNEQIKDFVKTKFNVDFPMFSKIEVNGPNADPLFDWRKQQKGGLITDDIKWNMTKFLLDKDGQVVSRYPPQTNPNDIEADIVKLL